MVVDVGVGEGVGVGTDQGEWVGGKAGSAHVLSWAFSAQHYMQETQAQKGGRDHPET